MVANTTIRSKVNSEQSAIMAMDEVVSQVPELHSSKDLAYLIGTGYGRNKVPFADENISEISCHAMGVHVTDPNVRAIIDIGGQDAVEDTRHGKAHLLRDVLLVRRPQTTD